MSEQDVHNFSTSSSSHRLPTVSASEALLNLDSSSRSISTGLPKLDAALQGLQSAPSLGSNSKGIRRGHVTEVYGPPGSGKTCFAMQLASNVLQTGDSVVWVDTASPLVGPRFKEILSSYRLPATEKLPSSPPASRSLDELLSGLTHIQAPSLPHLLSLFVHPPSRFPPDGTSLVVIDTVSSLFAVAFQKSSGARSRMQDGEKRQDKVQWAANRRWGIAGELLSKIGKMAATRDVAVLVINQTTTQLRGLSGAMLCSALSGSTWDSGIDNRIVLYRDMASGAASLNGTDPPQDLRFAGILKAGGKLVNGSPSAVDRVIPFTITSRGLEEIIFTEQPSVSSQPPADPLPLTDHRPKRKRDEIADSEDEGEEDDDVDSEYGWNEDAIQQYVYEIDANEGPADYSQI